MTDLTELSKQITAVCFGARGSIPTPTEEGCAGSVYGGQTTCWLVVCGSIAFLIDGGSGARKAGRDLAKHTSSRHIPWLITHYHHDHLQGMPFFGPLYSGEYTFEFFGPVPISRNNADGHDRYSKTEVERILREQQATPHFPVPFNSMPARKTYTDLPAHFISTLYFHRLVSQPGGGEGRLMVTKDGRANGLLHTVADTVKVTTIPLNHPDGCLGYRFDYNGVSFVFCTDTEPQRYPSAAITKVADKCDLLVMDGQLTETEIAGYAQGFGHGTPLSCLEQAIAANVDALLVTHFDPGRSDEKLHEMEEGMMVRANELNVPFQARFAREGRVYQIKPRVRVEVPNE